VAAVKYPPLGSRGAGSSTRAADYGFTYSSAEYFSRANEQTVVIPMVEERQAINNLPQILEVEGLDSVFIGQGDLSLSMGYPGDAGRPEVQNLVEQAKQQLRTAGLPLGALGASIEAAEEAFAEGATYFMLSLGSYLGNSFEQFLAAARSF
jgi:2-keto-3-deoxy-L-rhamnonate aldolase RhmA